MFVKSVILLNLKVFVCNSYKTGAPEKIKNPQKIARNVDFLSLAFYNAPSLHTVDEMSVFQTSLSPILHRKVCQTNRRRISYQWEVFGYKSVAYASVPKEFQPQRGTPLQRYKAQITGVYSYSSSASSTVR